MDRRELLIQEMQMLTGVVTNDYEYLVYLLMKEGTASDEVRFEETKFEQAVPIQGIAIEALDDWFKEL